MSKLDGDQVRGGVEVDDIIKLIPVNCQSGLPAVDGRRLTGLANDIVTLPLSGGYSLTWGGDVVAAGPLHFSASGDSEATPLAGLDDRHKITTMEAGVIRRFGWHTQSADATTVYRILVNGVSQASVTTTGVKGTALLNIPLATDDDVAIEYNSGTQPGRGHYETFIMSLCPRLVFTRCGAALLLRTSC